MLPLKEKLGPSEASGFEQAYSSATGWSNRIWSGCEAEFHKISSNQSYFFYHKHLFDIARKIGKKPMDCHCIFPSARLFSVITFVLSLNATGLVDLITSVRWNNMSVSAIPRLIVGGIMACLEWFFQPCGNRSDDGELFLLSCKFPCSH